MGCRSYPDYTGIELYVVRRWTRAAWMPGAFRYRCAKKSFPASLQFGYALERSSWVIIGRSRKQKLRDPFQICIFSGMRSDPNGGEIRR